MSHHSPISLFARVLGSEGNPPLIILHGLLGTSDNWQTLGKRFAESHEVHLLDQRNHGRSEHTAEHNYEAMANDLLHYINNAGLEEIDLLGHSMGAKTALTFADQHPDRIHSLVIADMAARAYSPHHQLIFEALAEAPITTAESRSEIEEFLLRKLDDASMVSFLMKNLKRSRSSGFQWRPNILVLKGALDSIVERVPLEINTTPTLVIYGGDSNYVSSDDVDEFEEQCMQLEIHRIEGAGHWLHASHPEEFYTAVNTFLDR